MQYDSCSSLGEWVAADTAAAFAAASSLPDFAAFVSVVVAAAGTYFATEIVEQNSALVLAVVVLQIAVAAAVTVGLKQQAVALVN